MRYPGLLQMMDDHRSNRWVIYEGDKWSLKEGVTFGTPQGSRVGTSFVTSCMIIYSTWTYMLERVSSASRMTHLSYVPLTTHTCLIFYRNKDNRRSLLCSNTFLKISARFFIKQKSYLTWLD